MLMKLFKKFADQRRIYKMRKQLRDYAQYDPEMAYLTYKTLVGIYSKLLVGIPVGNWGICFFVKEATKGNTDARYALSLAMDAWPDCADRGRAVLPVPGYTDDKTGRWLEPGEAYGKAIGTPIMWDRNHPYGAARIELLRFLIKEYGIALEI